MSLVSEALKKAQREAAAREARDKGLPPPLTPNASQPFRARRRRTPATWAAITIAALLVVTGAGLLVWTRAGARLASSRAQAETAPEKERLEVASPAASSQPGAGPAAAALAAPKPAPVPASSTDRRAPAAAPASPSMEASQGASATAAATPSPPPPRTTAAPVSPPAAAVSGGPASFVREATLADGTRLHLGGIAYSEAAPLAYLNGKLVGVGEHVEECRVARIERTHVALECSGAPVVLKLK